MNDLGLLCLTKKVIIMKVIVKIVLELLFCIGFLMCVSDCDWGMIGNFAGMALCALTGALMDKLGMLDE